MRDVLPFVILVKAIEFLIKLKGDTPTVLCILLNNSVPVHEYNQGAIVLAVDLKMRPRMKHIVIKYYHFRSFFANGDIDIQYIDTKEHIPDIL